MNALLSIRHVAMALACVLAPTLSIGAPGDTELVSVAQNGAAAGGSIAVDISGDGRYVLFLSRSGAIAPGDTNGANDWYLRDRASGQSTRVNLGNGGVTPDDGAVFTAVISDDGRFFAFDSWASNLVSGDTNGVSDIFLRNLLTGVVERVSIGSNEQQANSVSTDPALSADGRYVAFASWATNLGGNPSGTVQTVYVRDRLTGQTLHVGRASPTRCETPKISANGQVVGYTCRRTEFLYDATLKDRTTGVIENVNSAANGTPGNGTSFLCAISGDGRFVAFVSRASNLVAGDTNAVDDVFVRDRALATVQRISVAAAGGQGNGAASACDISADGRYVVFRSKATNLVAADNTADSEVFVRDRTMGTTQRVNVSSTGVPVSHDLDFAVTNAISADGQFVAFSTFAPQVVPNDTNLEVDAYVHQIDDQVPPPPDYRFTVKPQDGLPFGDVSVGTGKTLSLWLKNLGPTPLPVWSVTLVGLNANQYGARSNCGTLVAPGASCSIHVTFVPASVGIKWARVRIVAGDDLLRIRQLSGTGVP